MDWLARARELLEPPDVVGLCRNRRASKPDARDHDIAGGSVATLTDYRITDHRSPAARPHAAACPHPCLGVEVLPLSTLAIRSRRLRRTRPSPRGLVTVDPGRPIIVPLVLQACAFLLLVAGVEHYARRWVVPPVVWMLTAGLVYGRVDHWTAVELPAVRVDHDVTFYVFLPILLFGSARCLDLREVVAGVSGDSSHRAPGLAPIRLTSQSEAGTLAYLRGDGGGDEPPLDILAGKPSRPSSSWTPSPARTRAWRPRHGSLATRSSLGCAERSRPTASRGTRSSRAG